MKTNLVLFGLAVGVASLMVGPLVGAQEAKTAKSALSKPYTPVLGEMIASTISGVLATSRTFDGALTATYDKQADKIVVILMGSQNSVDGAKSTMDGFRKNAMPVVAGAIQRQYGVTLNEDSQLLLVYQNRLKATEVVRRENGLYVVK
ncbi:MAG TPA: hypothetical protein VFQ05_19065 [Candidatus Eisenbacteria bacterium]|nr:hypothetical protein [Candidatus Eisenbacteria bacterium]